MHGSHLGAEQLHPEHVESLALHIDGAHIDDAFEAEQRARRGRRHTVLSGAGLGNDAALSHSLGEKRLTDDVVDLVRAGVGQVLAFEKHAHPESLRESETLGDRGWSTGVFLQDRLVLGTERRVGPGFAERDLKFFAGRDERLGDEASTEFAEAAVVGRVAHQRWRAAGGNRSLLGKVGHGCGSENRVSDGPRGRTHVPCQSSAVRHRTVNGFVGLARRCAVFPWPSHWPSPRIGRERAPPHTDAGMSRTAAPSAGKLRR